MMQQRKITYKAFPRQHGPDSDSDSENIRNITCSSFRTPRGSIMEEKFIKIQCSQKKKGAKVLD